MDNFLKDMTEGPRKIAVTGHFGSGKTEFAVSLAFALADLREQGSLRPGESLALADLDLENPYFRSRERQDDLIRAGVRVYSDPYGGRNGSELQTLDSAIRAPLEDENCRVICDTGGDYTGARVLNQFKKYFLTDSRLVCVINKNRPGTDSEEKALYHLYAIQDSTGLKVTDLVSNSHFVRSTTPRDVLEGWEFTKQVSERSGIPVLCCCCAGPLADDVRAGGAEVFIIGMYMRESYLDRQV